MDPSDVFEDVADELGIVGAVTGRMFGHDVLKIDGKVFAILYDDGFAVKLGREEPALAEALLLPGAALFDPSGRGQPFGDWVLLPASESSDWREWAGLAMEQVRP